MDETKTVWISYTKFGSDVSRLDELLLIKPENFLCYSESLYIALVYKHRTQNFYANVLPKQRIQTLLEVF